MEEAILFSLSLFLVYVLVSTLVVSFPLIRLLGYVWCWHLRRCMSLLTTALLLNVEDLLALASVVPLCIPIVSLLLVLVLLFQSFVEATIALKLIMNWCGYDFPLNLGSVIGL
jgi:hypothetical protein